MKNINKWGLGVAVAGMMLSACTKNFEDLNKNPQVSENVPPEMLITQSEKGIVDRDFDWFYDAYSYQLQWLQFGVAAPGSSSTGLFSPTNTNDFYNAFYKGIGRNLVEIESVVAKRPEGERAQYSSLIAIAKILKVYSAWRASDANGSMPYTNAFQARSDANYTPTYDTQEKLFPLWDAELKAAVATLQSTLPTQASPGNAEIFYSGDIAKWAKAGNVLRIKLAMRVLKRTPDEAKAIIADAMSVKNGLFVSNADDWKFLSADQSFGRSGNWAMDNSPLSAGKNMLDYMQNNSDPRLNIFYEKNSYTKELIDSLIKGGAFPATAQYNDQRYIGLPANPDRRDQAADAAVFKVKRYTMKFTVNGKVQEITRTLDTVSAVQRRLFNLDAENGTNNGARYTQPILSYAEQCFMLAELSVRGIISGDPATYYNNGVEASIKAYDDMAREAKIRDYAPLAATAITDYLAKPGIAFTGSADEQLEKINIQNFLNLFKSPWEAWGAWKRTGIPKEDSKLLPLERMTVSGQPVAIPRRWALPQPTIANQTNWRNAITEMQKTGEYGNGDNDFTGRVWWDKK
ncbi:SusD/RagB family nutrient-binding outer membrane lipoprotein [Chitinophaga qingshengii]|uniref:SusD/RagB family nutrient-binding outer membrane lipoprotein n=1 Tax=Chitinophaga qingshengii TaxID=1569794 RepID=A0ABR7TSU1_9BACT|nr:SusD/RagB family nutrient-binding outer membrane lipoprotein [Chitinophaga qingshengii]MBC9932531.1 SusD/RagB family nutrient-binding outer membrane lipoprotein [Chitinophaga qingshengii]